MVHINITIPQEMKGLLDVAARRENIGRSTLIQRAVSFYVEVQERRRREALLKEGYIQMSGETAQLAKDFEFVDREASRHVD
ncbi:MAG: ribbon-helix-helix protein, CopG family [Candidatus Omnitrophica bacterium]|nr:ribbon-helix-helix protein, CopG family [Candidatus Omnitrophota bacterium]